MRSAGEGPDRRLIAFPPRYRSIVDYQTRTLHRQSELAAAARRAAAREVSDMMGLVAIGADQKAEALAGLSVSELRRRADQPHCRRSGYPGDVRGRRGFGAGIAKPVRRIAET